MPLDKYKGYDIWLQYSETYQQWTWDVNVNGHLGAGPAYTREQAESDARDFIDAYTAPGGPQFDLFGRLIKPKRKIRPPQGIFDRLDVEKMTTDRDVPGLIGVLGYKKDPETRQAAAKALGDLANRRAVEPLRIALNDEDKKVRDVVTEVLARFGMGPVDQLINTSQVERMMARDSKGTRYTTESQFLHFWATARDQRHIPIIIYRFSSLGNAHEAIIRLSYIHEAADTGELISSEVVDFGCYLNTGMQGEIAITGKMFTHDMWREAKEKLEAAGGVVYYEQEPERVTKKILSINSVATASSVLFVREDRKGRYTFSVHRGPSKAAAIAFLQENPVNRQLYYIVVETPEGTFGRDIQGIYKE